MKRTKVYLEGYADAYLRAFMASRGTGRAGEALGEALMLAVRGPQGLGEAWAGVVLADAAGVCEAHGMDPTSRTASRERRQVDVHGAAVSRTLRVSAFAAGVAVSAHANELIAGRIWGPPQNRSGRPLDGSSISAWVKVCREVPVVHVLEEGVGHLATRAMSEMDRAHALTDPTWIPRLVELMVLEGRLELIGCDQDSLATLIHEEGWSFAVPAGGQFSPLLDRWETEDGGWISAWAVAYEGRLVEETALVSAFREGDEGREWAVRVALALNAAWCGAHNRGALEEGVVELDARPIIDADPMAAIEEDV